MDARKLKDEAVEAVAKGKLGLALDLYSRLVQAHPGDAQLLVRLGDVQRRLGTIPEAIDTYARAAEGFEKEGLLLRAIAVSKLILELLPEHGPTQARLEDLHARRLGQVQGAGKAQPSPAAGAAAPAETRGSVPDTLQAQRPTGGVPVQEAARLDDILLDVDVDIEGLDAPATPPWAEKLPTIPLFSDLAQEAFLKLLEACRLRRLIPGEVAVQQGERGISFFVIVHGAMEVLHKDEATGEELRLATLQDGSFFGEMALLNGTPRTASVRALEETDLLEFTASTLRHLVQEHPSVANALRRFYRQRLLANVMATSPLFRPLAREARLHLIERFRSREVRPGEVLIAEGQPADGLFVLMSGKVEVSKQDADGGRRVVGEIREGEPFGEYSLLSGATASATCRMVSRGMVLRLPADEFRVWSESHPDVLALIEGVSGRRQRSNEAKSADRLPSDDDDLVLV